MANSPAWHQQDMAEVLRHFGSAADHGLSTAEARRRLSQYGANELAESRRVSPWGILAEQFKNVLIIILLVGVTLSAVLGHTVEALAIAVIVLFAAVLGFYQEFRAERAIEALRRMAAPTATVLRDGEELSVPAREAVPGDIIILRMGDKIPADARLIDAMNLKCDEAALTGESMPVEKQTAALANGALAVADRNSMVYAGTTVSYGRGRAVVVATGMKTEFGKIAQSLESVETSRTPLHLSLSGCSACRGVMR